MKSGVVKDKIILRAGSESCQSQIRMPDANANQFLLSFQFLMDSDPEHKNTAIWISFIARGPRTPCIAVGSGIQHKCDPTNYENYTVCPGGSDPLYVVTYYIKWVTTSWTHSISYKKMYIKN